MINSIERIKQYTKDWDDYNAEPATEYTINNALKFIDILPNNMNCKPIISLAGEGEICFIWKAEEYKLDLGFYGDGTYSYYGKDYSNNKELFDDDIIVDCISDEILQLITF